MELRDMILHQRILNSSLLRIPFGKLSAMRVFQLGPTNIIHSIFYICKIILTYFYPCNWEIYTYVPLIYLINFLSKFDYMSCSVSSLFSDGSKSAPATLEPG